MRVVVLDMSAAGALGAQPARKRPGPIRMSGAGPAAEHTRIPNNTGKRHHTLPTNSPHTTQKPRQQSIDDWLDSVKAGFAARFGKLFTEAGWEDVADLQEYPPSTAEMCKEKKIFDCTLTALLFSACSVYMDKSS